MLALGFGNADTLLALGVTPVAMSEWGIFENAGTGPWAEDLMKVNPQLIPIPQPDDETDLPYGQIRELEPDLILDTSLHDDRKRHDQLSRIAPVLAAPEDAGEFYVAGLPEQTLRIAQALGVPQEGQDLLDDLEAKATAAATDHPEFQDRTIATAMTIESSWYAQVAEIPRLKFFYDLGFGPTPGLTEEAAATVPENPDSIELTAKNFTKVMDADLVVVDATYSDNLYGGATSTAVTGDKRFAALPATRENRSFVFAQDPDRPYITALDRPSVLSANWLLDTLVPELSAALGQDGS